MATLKMVLVFKMKFMMMFMTTKSLRKTKFMAKHKGPNNVNSSMESLCGGERPYLNEQVLDLEQGRNVEVTQQLNWKTGFHLFKCSSKLC